MIFCKHDSKSLKITTDILCFFPHAFALCWSWILSCQVQGVLGASRGSQGCSWMILEMFLMGCSSRQLIWYRYMITIFCGNILQFYVYICLYCNFDSLYLGSASPFYSSGLGWFVAAIAQPGPERWWGRGWAQWHESWWDIHIFWDPKLDVDEQWWTCNLRSSNSQKIPISKGYPKHPILFTFQRVVSAEFCQAPDAVAAREQREDGGQRPSYPGFEQR